MEQGSLHINSYKRSRTNNSGIFLVMNDVIVGIAKANSRVPGIIFLYSHLQMYSLIIQVSF
jgi:hypothetical protein